MNYAAYDVGRYRPGSRELDDYPDYHPQDAEPIPTLRELLHAYADRGATATLWIEIKTSPYQRDVSSQPNALVRQIVDDVASAGVAHRTVLLAFEWDTLRFARSISSDIATDFLTLDPARVVALNRKLGAVDPYLLYGEFDPRRFGNSIPRAIKAAGGDWWGPLVHDVGARGCRGSAAARTARESMERRLQRRRDVARARPRRRRDHAVGSRPARTEAGAALISYLRT